MSRRLQPTLIDYLVIAINPALIMALIGSLVYFLLELFYQGEYPERLHFCLTMFIFAAVLIARISIEEGWERAAPFGIALGVLICVAMHRFVTYKSTDLAQVGWLINYGLIGLAWWCAHKLTWDCTLMDETQDASGEGLLQTVGLEAPEKASARTDEPRGDSILPQEADSQAGKSRWQRFVERRRRPHAPGAWIVYFSLAALPLFGVGQAFIPLAKTGSRQYAFLLLCVYVASALALLLTTSFLGLRRYLRGRRLEMPLPMAGTWLTIGAVLIVCLLLFTALLPRPNAEYAISELPFSASSEEHDSSPVSVGKEGTRDEDAKSAPGKRSRPEDQDSQPTSDRKSQTASGEDENSKAKSESKTDESKSGGSKPSNAKGENEKAENAKTEGSNTDDAKTDDAKPADAKSAEPDASKAKSDKSQEPEPSGGKPAEKAGKSPASGSESTKSPDAPAPPNLSIIYSALRDMTKLVIYGALAGLVLWLLFFHHNDLLGWLQALLNSWRELWGMMFGTSKAPLDVAPSALHHKSFADFSDPFATGVAGRYAPVALVQYSFEALEAWARDDGWPREPDETVYEFSRRIADHAEALAGPALALAELYSRAAYSPRSLPATTADRLREFWRALMQSANAGSTSHSAA